MTQHVLVLGATSTIAEAACRLYANDGASLLLVGRDPERLKAIAADLRVRGAADVAVHASNLNDMDPEAALSDWISAYGAPGIILLAYGILTDQRECEHDLSAAQNMIDTNFRSAAL